MWKKNILEPGRPQMTIWRMRIACWIPKATDTHSEYVILTAFPLQKCLHVRATWFRLYVHCMSCSVLFNVMLMANGRPGNSVGIATGYGLDGPGIESRCGRYLPHLSRPALGPTQPPVQWVPGLSPGVKSGGGVTLTPYPLLVPLVMKE